MPGSAILPVQFEVPELGSPDLVRYQKSFSFNTGLGNY